MNDAALCLLACSPHLMQEALLCGIFSSRGTTDAVNSAPRGRATMMLEHSGLDPEEEVAASPLPLLSCTDTLEERPERSVRASFSLPSASIRLGVSEEERRRLLSEPPAVPPPAAALFPALFALPVPADSCRVLPSCRRGAPFFPLLYADPTPC